MNVGDVLMLNITAMDYEGRGIAHYNSIVVFVCGALTSEYVSAKVTAIEKRFIEADVVEVITPSKKRIIPCCSHYAECGGCSLQHLSYQEQLAFKRQLVENTLLHVGKLDCPVRDTVSVNFDCYRNKVEVKFCHDFELLAGFFQRGSHKVFNLDKCLNVPNIVNLVIDFIRANCLKWGLSIFDEKSKCGSLREVVVRYSNYSSSLMVIFVTYDAKLKNIDFIVNDLINAYPMIKSIIHNVNHRLGGEIIGPLSKTIFGDDYLIDRILDINVKISAASFFQVNTIAAERLYQIAFDYARVGKNDIVIDAYSGIGSIALNVAKRAKYVYGIEIVAPAVENAKQNMIDNGIENVSFILGSCESKIREIVNDKKIDVIFVDPPRRGCDEKFIQTIIETKIPKVIYISCNVRTLARDLDILCNSGYEVKEVTPVDMFPQTMHVESVVLLSLKNN